MDTQRYFFLIFTLFMFSAGDLKAIPVEGYEAFGMVQGKGKEKSKGKTIFSNMGYANPSWTSDFEIFQIYVTAPTFGDNYFSAGFSGTAGNRLSDRDAYFMRFDYAYWGQSIAIKLTHIDENFLHTGKNIISGGYNGAFDLGKSAQIYLSLGMYYRFNLNRWNPPQWNPFNFNTEDREYYFETVVGAKILLGKENYITADLNNRDPFNSYNADFIAFDFSLNFVSSPKLTWRVTNSVRMSGFFVGTTDIGQETVLFGFVSKL